MKNLKRNVNGITLIALVISIIVLLILAGVSIAMLTGENGILKMAGEASEKTKIATEEEQREMARYEAAMNTERTYFQDVPIPAGFAPTRVDGESTVDEGLVITDSQGNEFVWIPCVAEKSEGDSNKVYYNDGENDDNREENWKSKQWYYNGGIWYDEQPHTIGKPSIEKTGNGGFYVARYEAGVPENADFYVSETSSDLTYKNSTYKNNTQKTSNLAPVSKKGNQVWNYISPKNAKTVAENMVKNTDVNSYLIDSHAWNTICRLIYKKFNTTNSVTDSKKWGNYKDNTTTRYERLKGLWANCGNDKGTLAIPSKYENTDIPKKTNNIFELATGICEDFKVYNIYDLAGNMWEITTETGKKPNSNNENSDTQCNENNCENPETEAPDVVARGGCCANYNSDDAVVNSIGDWISDFGGVLYGFRVVLYLK